MSKFYKVENLIDLTLTTCENWVKPDDDGLLRFVDPLDGDEITAHYGATHAAAAFIILGKLRNNTALFKKGKALLSSIISRWDKSKTLPGFHFDFNNFALCVAHEALQDIDSKLCKKIQMKVCSSSDSNHNTVNWLPMRWYVNIKRYEWTSEARYQKICMKCKSILSQAKYDDGGIEDRLPKGTSFNLQYNIATVGLMQFLRCRGLDLDISKEMGFLVNAVAPDGDINYQGRGANQIFAWGIWIYLLSSSNKQLELDSAISFLSSRVPSMLKNNNIMLNNWKGMEKYLWWDYHYSSVYIAHFFFWLVLSKLDCKKMPTSQMNSITKSSGLSIHRTSDYFISVFSGRKEYLAEKGPIISAIWIKKYGMIMKGTFGPWQGAFGNKYTFSDVILRNYCGLLKVDENKDWSKNKIINKLWPNLKADSYISVFPIISDFNIKKEGSTIIITFDNSKKKNVILNFPILENSAGKPSLSLFVNGEPMIIQNNINIRTQYGWCNIFQSKTSNAKEWVLKIK
tara:strand:- start:82 stop:1620 length:1539 start_codon:yes stop_codon:yes gene_type:complete